MDFDYTSRMVLRFPFFYGWAIVAVAFASGSYALAFSLAIGASLASALCIRLAAPRQIRAVAGRIGRR